MEQLNHLGASTILSLTEDSKNARLCNARYTQVRDSLFRSHPWNCLIKRVELARDTETPSWGFSYQFTLPSDCLRVLGILNYDYDFKVEGRKVVANHDTVKIQYVARITDANQYDELLRETISASLAADIAYSCNFHLILLHKICIIYFQDKLREARFVDATEGQSTNPDNGQSDVIGSSSFINSRY